MASRQPLDVHDTSADELRILGRRLGSSFMLSNAAVLLQHKPGAGGGRRESSDCLPASPATVADAPDSLGRRRGPMHHLLERRRRRGPEPQGMLAAVAEDRGPVGCPGSRVAARVALEGLEAAPLDTL